MFGKVSPKINDLLVKDYETYRSYYCGLCHEIKRKFGNLRRLTLNFDLVFLALLLDSMVSNENEKKDFRCILNPLTKKKEIVENNSLSYAADMLLLLTYFKIIDDCVDNPNIKNFFLKIFFPNKKFKKMLTLYEDKNNFLKKELKKLSNLENKKEKNLDNVSEPFALILAEIFNTDLINDTSIKKALNSFGFNLGRWIYVIDAIEDVKDDCKHKNYNPLLLVINEKNFKKTEDIKKILLEKNTVLDFYIKNMIEIFELLPIKKNKLLLNNIIRLGLKNTQENIIKKSIEGLDEIFNED